MRTARCALHTLATVFASLPPSSFSSPSFLLLSLLPASFGSCAFEWVQSSSSWGSAVLHGVSLPEVPCTPLRLAALNQVLRPPFPPLLRRLLHFRSPLGGSVHSRCLSRQVWRVVSSATKLLSVRIGFYELLIAAMQCAPGVLQEYSQLKNATRTLLLEGFAERESAVYNHLWPALLAFLQRYPDAWQFVTNAHSTLMPRLFALLRRTTGMMSMEVTYKSLLPLLVLMPLDVLHGGKEGGLEAFAAEFLCGVWRCAPPRRSTAVPVRAWDDPRPLVRSPLCARATPRWPAGRPRGCVDVTLCAQRGTQLVGKGLAQADRTPNMRGAQQQPLTPTPPTPSHSAPQGAKVLKRSGPYLLQLGAEGSENF